MMINTRNVGVFLVLRAPLNPIGAFDAEVFKANFRTLVTENPNAKCVGVDLSGLEFVYSDAYNAFIQFHQELAKRNGTFAVLANKESLAQSLKKVGLERYIRIFKSAEEMASYVPVEQKITPATAIPVKPTGFVLPVVSKPAPRPQQPAKKTQPAPVKSPAPAPQTRPVQQPKIMDKNPLVDEASSSNGTLIFVILLLLIVAGVVSYFVL